MPQHQSFRTDCDKASEVYFTRDISPAALMKLYALLNRKAQGRVAVKLSTGEAVIEYKEKDADDGTYTTTAPNTVGEYTVRVTVAADADYDPASGVVDDAGLF